MVPAEDFSSEQPDVSIIAGIVYNIEDLTGGSEGEGDGVTEGDVDNEKHATVGSGSRAQLASELGFSSNPSRSECGAKMKSFKVKVNNDQKEFTVTVHQDLVDEVKAIFEELNTSGFNVKQVGSYCYRTINNPKYPNSPVLSIHSFGAAIDLNWTKLNPFVSGGKPLTSGDDDAEGIMRTWNSTPVKIFEAHGWGWGGRYGDYMHFSKANGC